MEKFDAPKCGLWHPEDEPPESVDFITQAFQNKDGNTLYVQVPVCKDCISYLDNGLLNLNYCVGCNASQWRINREVGKTNQIRWMAECPKCK